jgi:hypothetical protein
MTRDSTAGVFLLLALATGVSAQSSIKRVTESDLDRFLTCLSGVVGKPVFPDVSVRWRPSVACPQPKEQLVSALAAERLRLFVGGSASFLVPDSKFERPTPPAPFQWTDIMITGDVQVWGDLRNSRVPTPSERQGIVAEVIRGARSVPLNVPFTCGVGGLCLVKVSFIVDIHRFRASSRTESFVAIVGQKDGNARLVFGELRGSMYRVVWDSPLFESLSLEPAYLDLDGDGADDILLSTARANRIGSQLVAFTRDGSELTRQSHCDIDPLNGYDASGGACPIVGHNIEASPPSDGRHDLLVEQRHVDDSSTTERYVLVKGRYVKSGGK